MSLAHRLRVRRCGVLAWAQLALLAPLGVHADPYNLRVDAIGYSQVPQPAVGLIALQGDDKVHPWVDAEALLWAGNRSGGQTATVDALVMMVRLHDPKHWADLRMGRQFATAGGLRPVHFDGASGRVRAPFGTSLEAFAGVPVQPQFGGYTPWGWVTGARVGQALGEYTSVGASYLQQRDNGLLSYEEVGVDFASAPTKSFDIAAHGVYDLVDPGLAEASISLAGRFGNLRPELFATHRSPSRLLPATSLFAALGDTPADIVGGSLRWRLFPRLDLLPTMAVRDTAGSAGVDATLRVTLRLDAKGDGMVSLEGRRQGSGPDEWTGVRFASRIPIALHWSQSTEIELVAPDNPRGRSSLWPWGLVALRYSPFRRWEIAGAVEAASTPTNTREINGLARLAWMWGGK